MQWLSKIHKLMPWLPSMRVFYTALLLVVIPMVFYKMADLMRSNDPPWKSDQDETTRKDGPAGAAQAHAKPPSQSQGQSQSRRPQGG